MQSGAVLRLQFSVLHIKKNPGKIKQEKVAFVWLDALKKRMGNKQNYNVSLFLLLAKVLITSSVENRLGINDVSIIFFIFKCKYNKTQKNYAVRTEEAS